MRPLLNRVEFKIARSKAKKANQQLQGEARAARIKIVEALSRQEHIGAFGREEGDHGAIQLPHESHHIAVMAGSSDLIYCKACSCWSLRSKLRGLAARCKGRSEGCKSTIRLLECGVQSAPQARLPPQYVKKRPKRARW